jgi:predicted esterase
MISRSILVPLASFCFLLAPAAAAGGLDEPEGKPPDPMAPAHHAFAWKSKNDLRFVWWLPKDYETKTPRNMTVICHGTGLDFRWGYWNNKPGLFRPDDIVISVDGPTPDHENRLFLGEKKDADAFAAFLTEMRQTFAVDRIFLYGHSQGGFFTVYFAGEHPEMVAGVVAHASGAWNWSKMKGDVKKVAIAFMHGSSDPVVPYAQSPGSRDAYAKAGFELLHMRRLDRYNHYPNAVRANETLSWCQGMTAKTPEEALGCALAILHSKPKDEYEWETVVGYSGARDVLRRLEKKGPAPFEQVAPEAAANAAEWIGKIDAAGAEHVAALRKLLKSKRDLKLDSAAWLGHLVPLREDFRGVESVEAYIKELDFDALAQAHAKVAGTILTAWYNEKNPKKIYEAIVENIGKAFLFDGFPPDLSEKMKGWHQDEKRLGVSPTVQKKHADFEAWAKGWEQGLKEYASIWKKWKGP